MADKTIGERIRFPGAKTAEDLSREERKRKHEEQMRELAVREQERRDQEDSEEGSVGQAIGYPGYRKRR